jgi:hypothetical protein
MRWVVTSLLSVAAAIAGATGQEPAVRSLDPLETT